MKLLGFWGFGARYAVGMGLAGGGFLADVTVMRGWETGATSMAFSVGYMQP